MNPSPKSKKTVWCVPKAGVSDAQLQVNIDYACGHGVDCSAIQPGGACFEPNTVASHAAYAMNLLYQTAGRNPWNCDFSQTATLSTNNPSAYLYFGFLIILLFIRKNNKNVRFWFLFLQAIMVVLTLGGVPDLWARHRLILFGSRRKVVSNFAEDRNLSILFPLDMLRNYPVAWFVMFVKKLIHSIEIKLGKY